MSEGWEKVGGRRVAVHEPAGKRPRAAVLSLHDLEEESPLDRAGLAGLLDEMDLALVAPQGGPCWWAARVCPGFDPVLTPEQFLLEQVVPWVRARWGLGGPVGLFGVGMGGQGALRLAFRHPRTFPVVAAVDAALDHHELYGRGTALDDMYDSKEQCRQDTAILHVHPAHYPPHIFFSAAPDSRWFRGNDRLHEKLAALGIAHETRFTGGDPTEAAVRFVGAGLVQESRRLL